jgi:hypothetical protein
VYLAIPFTGTDESSRNRALKGSSDKLPKTFTIRIALAKHCKRKLLSFLWTTRI